MTTLVKDQYLVLRIGCNTKYLILYKLTTTIEKNRNTSPSRINDKIVDLNHTIYLTAIYKYILFSK